MTDTIIYLVDLESLSPKPLDEEGKTIYAVNVMKSCRVYRSALNVQFLIIQKLVSCNAFQCIAVHLLLNRAATILTKLI